MPVLRQKERIKEGYRGGQSVNVEVRADQQLQRSTSAILAQQGRVIAESLGTQAVDHGRALAKAHVFALNDLGVPEMPEEAKKRMGTLAARAYDQTIDEKFAHQMTTAMRSQIADAQNANQYDFEAFVADAEGRLEAMRADIPEEMMGAFQQVSNGLMADAGIAIGQRNAQLAQRDAIQRNPMIDQQTIYNMEDMILRGGEDAAVAMAQDRIQEIRIEPPDQSSLKEKADRVDAVATARGWALLKKEYGITEETHPEELARLRLMFEEKDEGLRDYFTIDGEFFPQAMENAKSEVNRFYALANANLGKRNAAIEKQIKTNEVKNGSVEGVSGDTPDIRTDVLEQTLNIPDPETGLQMQITQDSWIDGSIGGDDMVKAVQIMKSTGGPDRTLLSALTAAGNSRDPDTMAALFPVIEELLNGPNMQNKPQSFAEYIPESVLNLHTLAMSYAGGNDPGAAHYGRAVEMVSDLPTITDEDMPAFLKNAGLDFDAAGIWTGDVKPENWKQVATTYIMEEVFDGVQVKAEDKEKALKTFLTHVQTGSSVKDARDITKTAYSNMYGEIDDGEMGSGYTASAWATSKWYGEIPATTVPEMWDKVKDSLGTAESNFWNFFGTPRRKIYEMFGDDYDIREYQRASTFERLANPIIMDAIKNGDVSGNVADFDPAEFTSKTGDQFYVKGEDYILVPIEGMGEPPKYRVFLNSGGEAGTQRFDIPLDTPLDVAPAYAEATRQTTIMKDAEKIMRQRAIDFMSWDEKTAAKVFTEITRLTRNNEAVDVEEIIDRFIADGVIDKPEGY